MTLQMITETTTVASPPPPLVPDLNAAERFLAALDPFEGAWVFQTFTDMRPAPKPDPLAEVITGTLEDVAERLTRLNRRGAGVFVTINQTDGKGRRKENITAIRALWQEADRGDEPDLPVEPHIVVETSPGKAHRYLLVQGMPLEAFEPAQQVMVDHFGSDSAAKDRARVLRLPGFWHVKDPSRPHLVRLAHESGQPPLTWEALQAALPAAVKRDKAAPIPGLAGAWNGNVVPKPRWPANRAEIESALASLDPDMGYESWIKVGMALHQESGGAEDAQNLWDNWSAGGSKYTPDGCSDKWRSFSAKGVNGTNIGSLFWLAKGAGWAGWQEPSRLEKLLEESNGLTPASSTSEIEPILREIARLGPIDQDRLYQSVKDHTGLALATLRRAGQKPKKQGDAEDVDQLTLAKAIRHAVGAENIIGQESGVWIYREERGIWRELSAREERQLVQTHLDDAKARGKIEAVSKGLVDGVTDVLKSEVHREDHNWEQGPDEAVSTPGGVLVLDDKFHWGLQPHRREDYRTVQIPVEWIPTAKCPRFEKFLAGIFLPDGAEEAADKATALLEMMGYSLMAHSRHEKFIILVGEGSNGKSVLLAVLERLLGTHNVAGVQPSQFDRAFQRAHLHLKLANIVTEVRQGEVIADAELKGITSGETSTVERKFQHPFNLKPYSTCWFGTNHLPHTRDFSDALFRRALVVRFNRKFSDQDPSNLADPHLKEDLFQELPGILRRCLTAYAEALKNRRFTEPDSCREAKKAWRLEADQAAQFIEEACKEEGETGSSALFHTYLAWADDQGIRQKLNQKSFSERLVRLGYSKTKTKSGIVVKGLTLHPETRWSVGF